MGNLTLKPDLFVKTLEKVDTLIDACKSSGKSSSYLVDKMLG